MQIILLEKYKRFNVGDIINVKDGFARNYLVPHKKAVQATEENIKLFEEKKEKILQETQAKLSKAEEVRAKINGVHLHLVKQAGVDDRLYGSITANDIVKALEEQTGEVLNKSTVVLSAPIKYLGCHSVNINLFADVTAQLNLVIARTLDEAEAEVAKLAAPKPETSGA